jgi:hypothetical protein
MEDSKSDSRDDSNSQRSGNNRGAGVPPAVFFPQGAELKTRSRRLPHWEVTGGTYFVTFRLADALPKKAIAKIEVQRKDIVVSATQGFPRLR